MFLLKAEFFIMSNVDWNLFSFFLQMKTTVNKAAHFPPELRMNNWGNTEVWRRTRETSTEVRWAWRRLPPETRSVSKLNLESVTTFPIDLTKCTIPYWELLIACEVGGDKWLKIFTTVLGYPDWELISLVCRS